MLLFDKNLAVPNETLIYLKDLTNTDPLEREIATDLLASNLERIHQDGKAVNGEQIGEYAEVTKIIRQDPPGLSSRQIEFVDLFFTGKLHGDLIAAPADGGWGVGFQTSYGSGLRKKNEAHFKKKIWGITKEDDQVMERTISAFISNPRSGSIF